MENNPGLSEEEFPRYKKNKVEEKLSEEEQKIKWRKEMDENKALQEYFSQFDPASVKNFIDSLLSNKLKWVNYGPRCLKNKEDEETQWIEQASEHLFVIQQKKLFDKQCLWRAENIAIEEIEIGFEFELWRDNVLNCPFIDPVTEADIALYVEYLQTGNADIDINFWFEWQDYDEMKAAWNDASDAGIDFPDWYDFHNNRTGAGMLMNLPDIRGQKEEFYRDLTRQHNQANADPVTPHKPWLVYYQDGLINWYTDTFESKEIRKLYGAWNWHDERVGQKEDLEDELKLLFAADEPVPVQNCSDWKEAIKMAADRYRKAKIAEALPSAWEQYMINIDTGISFQADAGIFGNYKYFKELYMQTLLKGRILNGEPGDMNF